MRHEKSLITLPTVPSIGATMKVEELTTKRDFLRVASNLARTSLSYGNNTVFARESRRCARFLAFSRAKVRTLFIVRCRYLDYSRPVTFSSSGTFRDAKRSRGSLSATACAHYTRVRFFALLLLHLSSSSSLFSPSSSSTSASSSSSRGAYHGFIRDLSLASFLANGM